jgi:hypothetical protein
VRPNDAAVRCSGGVRLQWLEGFAVSGGFEIDEVSRRSLEQSAPVYNAPVRRHVAHRLRSAPALFRSHALLNCALQRCRVVVQWRRSVVNLCCADPGVA